MITVDGAQVDIALRMRLLLKIAFCISFTSFLTSIFRLVQEKYYPNRDYYIRPMTACSNCIVVTVAFIWLVAATIVRFNDSDSSECTTSLRVTRLLLKVGCLTMWSIAAMMMGMAFVLVVCVAPRMKTNNHRK